MRKEFGIVRWVLSYTSQSRFNYVSVFSIESTSSLKCLGCRQEEIFLVTGVTLLLIIILLYSYYIYNIVFINFEFIIVSSGIFLWILHLFPIILCWLAHFVIFYFAIEYLANYLKVRGVGEGERNFLWKLDG